MAASTEPPAPRTAAADILGQAWLAVLGRTSRSVLTSAGVALGIAATIATVCITSSAAAAISGRFNAAEATQVTLRYSDALERPGGEKLARVRRLNGVVEAGFICRTRQDDNRAQTVRGVDASSVRLNLVAAQPEALKALGVRIDAGRWSAAHDGRAAATALLDDVAARDLGLADPVGKLIFLNDRETLIVGTYRAPTGVPDLTAAVVLPYELCGSQEVDSASRFRPSDLVIRTRLGAAGQVAREAPHAAEPTQPDAVVAVVPPELSTFRRGVEDDTRSLFLGLAVVSMVIGALGVSNTTLVSVMERRPEIGLRRAVGASRRAVAAQFLTESGMLGLAGGLLGTCVGICVAVIVALLKDWLLVLPLPLVLAGPAMGLAIGTLAGVYPAWSASRVAPASILRSG